MKRTILLTGKTGQVGSELLRVLPQLGEVIAPDRLELNLLDPHQIRQVVRNARPHLIVNAAAYTAVDASETDEATAWAVNVEAPALLAEEAKKIDASLVHYSTDYVFDGSKSSPYSETDSVRPLSVYGKTKLAGERALRNAGVSHLIFRTAWVYATRGHNFLLKILQLATEREELRVVCDQTGSPTWAKEIALATSKILTGLYDQGQDASHFARISGTYHMTAGGQTTWYDFARNILDRASTVSTELPWFMAVTSGRPLVVKRLLPILAAEYPFSTPRPAYSVLSNACLTQTFELALPDWRSQLQKCFLDDTIAAKEPLKCSLHRHAK